MKINKISIVTCLVILSFSGWITSGVIYYFNTKSYKLYDDIRLDNPVNIITSYFKDAISPKEVIYITSSIVSEKRSFAQQGSLISLCENNHASLSKLGGGMSVEDISSLCKLVINK